MGKQKIGSVACGQPSVKDAGEMFLKDRRLSGLREPSVLAYKYRIDKMQRYFGEKTPIDTINRMRWQQWIEYLTDTEKLSPEGINATIRHGRAFLYWCMEEGMLSPYKIHTIKTDKKIKETYTHEELDRLLEEPKSKDFREILTYTFIMFLYGTGCRIGTVLDIRIEDLDFQFQRFKIRHSKDRIQTYLPMPYRLSVALKKYLVIRGGSGDDYLFPNPYGDKPCQREYNRYVASYNKARGVQKTSVHLFRHSFARGCAEQGMSALDLRDLLCHKTLSVTQGYIDMYAANRLQNTLDKNPLDNREISTRNKRKKLY